MDIYPFHAFRSVVLKFNLLLEIWFKKIFLCIQVDFWKNWLVEYIYFKWLSTNSNMCFQIAQTCVQPKENLFNSFVICSCVVDFWIEYNKKEIVLPRKKLRHIHHCIYSSLFRLEVLFVQLYYLDSQTFAEKQYWKCRKLFKKRYANLLARKILLKTLWTKHLMWKRLTSHFWLNRPLTQSNFDLNHISFPSNLVSVQYCTHWTLHWNKVQTNGMKQQKLQQQQQHRYDMYTNRKYQWQKSDGNLYILMC